MDIRHVVVLMLENRSFDCMLGMLYPKSDAFDGLAGTETNIWHKDDGTQQELQVRSNPEMTAQTAIIPDPDPGELFIVDQNGGDGAGSTLSHQTLVYPGADQSPTCR